MTKTNAELARDIIRAAAAMSDANSQPAWRKSARATFDQAHRTILAASAELTRRGCTLNDNLLPRSDTVEPR